MELTLEEFCQQLPSGTRVGEHYVIEAMLGAGGMGLVMLAYDELLRRRVALKFLQPSVLSRADALRSLITEARAMARVRHHNVVEVHAFGTYTGVPYLVMEYVPGFDGERWLMERSRGLREFVPVDEVLGIIDQVCAGVAAIHASGAVHGDLKPTNVLIGEDLRVAVADLGIAMLLDSTEEDGLGGTPEYLAPEAMRWPRDPALFPLRDVFALGVMTYEFLTNERPFMDTRLDNFAAATRAPAPPASQYRPDLPPAFDEVLRKALAFDPHERTQSVVELRRALADARKRSSVRARPWHVLVVDDDTEFARFVQLTLQAHIPGMVVTVCTGAQDAIARLAREPADLALLDLAMPGMNGMELTAELRTRWSAAALPILIATAHGGASDWKVLSSLGANGFLAKPIEIKQLVGAVSQQLERGLL